MNRSKNQKMHHEVEDGYIDVTASQANIDMADSEEMSTTTQVSASTSSASNVSSHRIHTRETTAEYPSSSRIPPSHDATNIRRLQSEIEWLYERNAELQDEIENLKAKATTKERDIRQSARRLQTEVNMLQNALDEAERQNRSLEATIKNLRMQRLETREGAQSGRGPDTVQGFTHSRSGSTRGIPASTSATDSLVTNDSVASDSILDSRVTDLERDAVGAHQHFAKMATRRIRKKVSWQDEIGESKTLFSRPAPPPINVPSASLPAAGIMKASPQIPRLGSPPPGSSPPLQAYHLTSAPPSVSDWVRTPSIGKKSQRRASDTPSPGPARSLFEELRAAGQLQSSTSQVSSESGHLTLRPTSEGIASIVAGDSGDVSDDRPSDDQDTDIEAEERKNQKSTMIERCTAVVENHGSDFWQRLQFYCIVGIFLAGVLSRGREGVMELGKRR
ncbi:hypothetical protein NliqN6_6742 [Naganishia liquefaciens]|uniref:Uncharacterized protein n=1 Tax=Naganishia liquefaciens TaxID=104408 RepID=A0A8H3YHS8_9TREE|nr:hypothetical protein NliqN6_6742 [Naganishia liquefaciens]